MDLKTLIFSTLLSLSWGTQCSFALAKPSAVGPRYFLYHGLGVASLFLGLALLFPEQSSLSLWLCFVFSVAASVLPGTPLGKISLAGGILTGAIALGSLFPGNLWLQCELLGSGLLLGFTLAAMLVGHWYLIIPKLPIEELRRVTLVMMGLLVVRLIECGISVLMREKISTTEEIFLWMRFLWGLGLPLFLCYFLWQTIKIRSTQSATGILYVMVVAVLIGETLSQYLLFSYGSQSPV